MKTVLATVCTSLVLGWKKSGNNCFTCLKSAAKWTRKLSLAKLRLLQTLYNSRKIVQDSGKVIVSEHHWWNTDRYNTSRCAAICKQTARSTQTNSSWKSLKEIYCYILDKISDHRCIVNVFYWKCKTWLLKLLLLSEEKTFTPADVYHLQSNL